MPDSSSSEYFPLLSTCYKLLPTSYKSNHVRPKEYKLLCEQDVFFTQNHTYVQNVSTVCHVLTGVSNWAR